MLSPGAKRRVAPLVPHSQPRVEQRRKEAAKVEQEKLEEAEREEPQNPLLSEHVSAVDLDKAYAEPDSEPLAERSPASSSQPSPPPLFVLEILRMDDEADREAKDALRVEMLRAMIKAGLTISLSRVPVYGFGSDLRRGLRRRVRRGQSLARTATALPSGLARAASLVPHAPGEPPIGHRIFVKVSMSAERLDEEADRMQILYRRRPVPLPIAQWSGGSAEDRAHCAPERDAEGASEPLGYLENIFQEFSIAEREEFVDCGEHNSYTRYKMELLESVLESRGARGCGLRLRELQEKEAIAGWFYMHEEQSADGKANCQWLIRNWVMGAMWRPPTALLRNHFGEKIGFYFAFMESYTRAVVVPALCGAGVYIAQKATGVTDLWAVPFYSIFVVVWAVLFLEGWKRRQAALAHRWGVTGFRRQERNRPEYLERPGARRITRDLVSGEAVPEYTFWERLPRFVASYSAAALAALLVVAASVSLLVFRFLINSYLPYTVAVVNSVFIMAMDFVYKRVAWKLTDLENHRYESAYEGRLILKLFAFQFVNNYCSLFYYAFYEGSDPEGCGWRGPGSPSCGVDMMGLLGNQLAAILVIRTVSSNTIEIYLPVALSVLKRGAFTARSLGNATVRNGSLSERTLLDSIDDMMDVVVGFGFVVLFAAAFPAAAAVVLLNNALRLRTDTYKLLRVYERPRPQRAPDLGPWTPILQFMAFASVITNSGMVLLTSRQLQSNWGLEEFARRLVAVASLEHAVFLLQFLLAVLIPDVPRWVQNEEKLAAAWSRHLLQFREVAPAGAARAALHSPPSRRRWPPGRPQRARDARMLPSSQTMAAATGFDPDFAKLPYGARP
eukprot:tig00000889_g5343.t1